jgi:hypothetical protein
MIYHNSWGVHAGCTELELGVKSSNLDSKKHCEISVFRLHELLKWWVRINCCNLGQAKLCINPLAFQCYASLHTDRHTYGRILWFLYVKLIKGSWMVMQCLPLWITCVMLVFWVNLKFGHPKIAGISKCAYMSIIIQSMSVFLIIKIILYMQAVNSRDDRGLSIICSTHIMAQRQRIWLIHLISLLKEARICWALTICKLLLVSIVYHFFTMYAWSVVSCCEMENVQGILG